MKHVYSLEADTLFKRFVRHLFLIPVSFSTGAVGMLAMHYLSIVMEVDIKGPADEEGVKGWIVFVLAMAVACATMMFGLHISSKICRALGV
ncbi:hypothetical protein MHO82_00880 [Vibrio sp. Of7-15]|uniref:hypothetical protein n=1 Tax=Vibrio sp. Of7-15 TaxID=2724879 RepID=UPI001EF17845|nr:hypothetical protein [Vibrio sp. Of7-15]MCG7495413.1 hypothetical protein [Vibrio sp. Of7-15]